MGSFDAGYGSTRMARLIGQKRARELWFLCRYMDAEEAASTGLINACYPHEDLEGRTVCIHRAWNRQACPVLLLFYSTVHIVSRIVRSILGTMGSKNRDEFADSNRLYKGGPERRRRWCSWHCSAGRRVDAAFLWIQGITGR